MKLGRLVGAAQACVRASRQVEQVKGRQMVLDERGYLPRRYHDCRDSGGKYEAGELWIISA